MKNPPKYNVYPRIGSFILGALSADTRVLPIEHRLSHYEVDTSGSKTIVYCYGCTQHYVKTPHIVKHTRLGTVRGMFLVLLPVNREQAVFNDGGVTHACLDYARIVCQAGKRFGYPHELLEVHMGTPTCKDCLAYEKAWYCYEYDHDDKPSKEEEVKLHKAKLKERRYARRPSVYDLLLADDPESLKPVKTRPLLFEPDVTTDYEISHRQRKIESRKKA